MAVLFNRRVKVLAATDKCTDTYRDESEEGRYTSVVDKSWMSLSSARAANEGFMKGQMATKRSRSLKSTGEH